jgi:hypothetical protein
MPLYDETVFGGGPVRAAILVRYAETPILTARYMELVMGDRARAGMLGKSQLLGAQPGLDPHSSGP